MLDRILATPASVRYVLDVRERDAALAKISPPKMKRAALIISISYAMIALNGALQIARPDRTFSSVVIGATFITLTLVVFVIAMVTRTFSRPRLIASDTIGIAFGEHGMTLDGAIGLIPWRDMKGATDTLAAFVIGIGRDRVLIVPKRNFEDDGGAVWAYLVAHLIGKKLLRRAPGSRTIVATAEGR